MTTAPTPKAWLDTRQAAEYLGLSPRQVERARRSGNLGYTRLGGQRVLHSVEQLDAYIERCTTHPAPGDGVE